jgi:hypothetical protein
MSQRRLCGIATTVSCGSTIQALRRHVTYGVRMLLRQPVSSGSIILAFSCQVPSHTWVYGIETGVSLAPLFLLSGRQPSDLLSIRK